MLTEDFVPIAPVEFFDVSLDIRYVESGKLSAKTEKTFRLPQLTDLCAEDKFAEVAMGWNEEGLEFFISPGVPVRGSSFPQLQEGDSVELFLDTRDVKTSGFTTRYCHHFYFMPESHEGRFGGEITRFRTEDRHELSDPAALVIHPYRAARSYQLQMTIPKECLFGYDPQQFNRLGFSYRINRAGDDSQHFSVITDDFSIEQQPSLWASGQLIN